MPSHNHFMPPAVRTLRSIACSGVTMFSPCPSRCPVVRPDVCPVATSAHRSGSRAGRSTVHWPTLVVGQSIMAVGQHAVRAVSPCIPMPTWTRPQGLARRRASPLYRCCCGTANDRGRSVFSSLSLLWTPAQRKRASMLYFANVFFIFFFNGRLILRPWLTEVRESFTRGGP